MNRSQRLIREGLTFLKQTVSESIRGNDSLMASRLRSKMYGTSCVIDTGVRVTNPANFVSGRNSSLYHACFILNGHGRFVIGNGSHLGAFCYVNVHFGYVNIGDDVAIGPGTKIIAYSNNAVKGKKVTEEKIVGSVFIGNNVFIGANCTILPNSNIQDNVVVGAGAVVKGTLEHNSVYAGVPAKKLRSGWYA